MKIIRRTPEEVFDHWVLALRSGVYKQGRNTLKTSSFTFDNGEVVQTTFCCMGVVCDLAAKDGGPQWSSNSADRSVESFMGQTSVFPEKMRQFLAISSNEISDLIGMNDYDRLSFKEIADLLDKILKPRCLVRLEKRLIPD